MAQWRIVKLELARTEQFPGGSPSRTYLLRLPLDDDGLIDEGLRAADPIRATVRRYWPNQPDQSGYILPKGEGWAFSSVPGDRTDETLFYLENRPIRQGGCITLTEPDGTRLPFRVVTVKSP